MTKVEENFDKLHAMNNDFDLFLKENDNDLIAKFVGWEYEIHSNTYRLNDIIMTELNFHKDWNLLIQCVEKIESLDLKEYGYKWEGIDGETEYNNGSICVEIEQKTCWIYMNLSLDPMHTLNPISRKEEYDTKIEATFKAVVEFINYYNELYNDNKK